MRKFVTVLLFLLLVCAGIRAQDLKTVNVRGGFSVGLYDYKTATWIIPARYTRGERIGVYKGITYYCLYKGEKYAIFNSKGKQLSDFEFYFLPPQQPISEGYLCLSRKQFMNGGYGILSLDPYGEVVPFIYTATYFQGYQAVLVSGSKNSYKDIEELNAIREKKLAAKVEQPVAPAEPKTPTTTQVAAVTQPAPAQRPVVKILSPSAGPYTSTDAIVRYQAKTFDGSVPNLRLYVNGTIQDVKWDNDTRSIKADYKEVKVSLPDDVGKSCVLRITVEDGGFRYNEDQVELIYAGVPHKPDLHILAVGINDYRSQSLDPLKSAVKDAHDFVNAIQQLDLSDYSHVHSDIIPQEQAERDVIIDKMDHVASVVHQGDVVIFFMAGHSILTGKNDGYFMAVNSDAGKRWTGVAYSEIRGCVKQIVDKKANAVLFMDSCHAGAMMDTRGNLPRISLSEPDLVGFYSSTANQLSSEKDGNGIFTRALVEGLKGAAAEKGIISVNSLHTFLDKKVNDAKGSGLQSVVMENERGVNFELFRVKQ